MGYFPAEFLSFIQPNADRYTALIQFLQFKHLPYSVIPLGSDNHILLTFSSSSYNPQFKIKTIIAHYDCSTNSCGANDNAAAVYQTICFAERLLTSKLEHNTRILFTASEELGAQSGVTSQGAFAIASCFKKLGVTTSDIFALDCCGRGDVIVVSTAGKNCGTPHFKDHFDDLFSRSAELARQVSPQKWVTLPVPYGDNAGFIASGIPAVAITVLPQSEATDFMRRLQRNRSLEDAIMNRKPYNRDELPLTWRMIHGEFDTEQSLTPDAFEVVGRFLDALAQVRKLA